MFRSDRAVQEFLPHRHSKTGCHIDCYRQRQVDTDSNTSTHACEDDLLSYLANEGQRILQRLQRATFSPGAVLGASF